MHHFIFSVIKINKYMYKHFDFKINSIFYASSFCYGSCLILESLVGFVIHCLCFL